MARNPRLYVRQLLQWADSHYARTGKWPNLDSGRVFEARHEKWLNIDMNLRDGSRGLPGGGSLAQLLAEFRGKRNLAALPPHTEDLIRAWAVAHRHRTGQWPRFNSGPITDAPGESWSAVDMALHAGSRGLPGGSSLADLFRRVRRRRKTVAPRASTALAFAPEDVTMPLLDQRLRRRPIAAWAKHRRHRSPHNRPRLTVDKILIWADAYFERTGDWPTSDAGRVDDAPDETWVALDIALHRGLRGLPAGSSLPQLLADKRDARNQRDLPPLTVGDILTWADAHYERTGVWPTDGSGPVLDAPGETWSGVCHSLVRGTRGLPRASLARLLGRHCGVYRQRRRPRLFVKTILTWADAFRARTGAWPGAASGPIPDAPRETWYTVQNALYAGQRGLPCGLSLSRLLAEHRGVRNVHALEPYSIEQILAWADSYHARHGAWPNKASGAIDDSPEETWGAVQQALRTGLRGFWVARRWLSFCPTIAASARVPRCLC